MAQAQTRVRRNSRADLGPELSPIRSHAAVALIVILLSLPAIAHAQWSGRDGWVEEPGAKSLNLDSAATHAYLDSASVHRGSDGLVYFNESTDVAHPEDIGTTGLMKDAYDCAKNIKYMCVGGVNWRNDTKSSAQTNNDPALPVYRKYLCGDAGPNQ
jgi:hypothetical protein